MEKSFISRHESTSLSSAHLQHKCFRIWSMCKGDNNLSANRAYISALCCAPCKISKFVKKKKKKKEVKIKNDQKMTYRNSLHGRTKNSKSCPENFKSITKSAFFYCKCIYSFPNIRR